MGDETERLSFEHTDVAFAYKSDRELKRSAWLFSLINNNLITRLGTRLTPLAFKLRLPVKGLVRATIFGQFCGGETLEECKTVVSKLSSFQVDTILDYGVEAKETREEFEKTVQQVTDAISFALKNQHIPFVSIKITGLAPFGLLEKLHEGKKLEFDEVAECDLIKDRLYRVCKAAEVNGVGVMIDAEESWIQNPLDDWAMEMMKLFNRERPVVYNTVQLYRTDRIGFLKKSFDQAKNGNFYLGVKLVRGAYMEKERRRAEDMNYASPIQHDKSSSDRDYNEAVKFCLENIDRVSFCIASHNEHSNLLGAEMAISRGIMPSNPHLHFSQLYGMSDNITFNLARAGFNVTKYLPYGPVEDVVPYLMRRAQENTSVGGMSSRELMLIKKELRRRGNQPS